MLRFQKVTKRYGTIIALKDISFEITPGEFIFLVGPSGAGKSTVLRLLIRDTSPTTGSIHFREHDIAGLSRSQVYKLRRLVAAIYQDYKLLNDRTVEENILLVKDILGNNDKTAKIELEQVDLWSKRSYFPAQLSGGELQRVSIARAIALKPKIIFADEPTGNLDPKSARHVIELLERLNQDGVTVIVATHNSTLVNKFKKRVLELSKGKLIRDQKKGKYEAS